MTQAIRKTGGWDGALKSLECRVNAETTRGHTGMSGVFAPPWRRAQTASGGCWVSVCKSVCTRVSSHTAPQVLRSLGCNLTSFPNEGEVQKEKCRRESGRLDSAQQVTQRTAEENLKKNQTEAFISDTARTQLHHPEPPPGRMRGPRSSCL